jgi:hypothetical protein
MKEYQVLLYKEGMLGSFLFSSSKVNPERFGNYLNSQAAEGWRVVAIEREIRRMLLFWKREAFLVIMERDR